MKTQASVISALKKDKNAYPHKVFKVNVEETHISWILLTGKFAYKIKKELKFGNVLDFSTLPLRKKFISRNSNSLLYFVSRIFFVKGGI